MRSLVFAIGLAIAALALPAAQTPPQVTFRTGIDVITVDAMVTDHGGHPVTNLTAADFEIKEHGKLQTIDTFKFVGIDDASAELSQPGEILSEADQERESQRADVRLIVLFLDDYHVDRVRALALRDTLANFVRELNSNDLVAIMFPITPVASLTFSRDHEAQARIIERFEGRKFDFFPKNDFDQRYTMASSQEQQAIRNQLSSAALKEICVRLQAARDGPKSLIVVTEGLDERVPQYLELPGALIFPPHLDRDPRTLIEVANETGKEVSTVDARGVASDDLDLRQTLVEAAQDRKTVATLQEQLRNLAYETNGLAMVNTFNYTPVLRQILHMTGAYYLLGYTSTEKASDGLFHEISVHVKRSGVDLRARKGYWAPNKNDLRAMNTPAPTAAPAEITHALADLAVAPSSSSVRTWVATAKGDAEKTDVMFVWEPAGGDAAAHGASVTAVNVKAVSSGGTPIFQGTARRETIAGGRVTFTAPPGELMMHVVATAADGSVIDAGDRAVTLPDFTGTSMSFSTPLVFRARTALDIQRIKATAAPLPTVTRQFQRTERLLVRFHAYGPAGTTPAVTMHLLNARGQSVSTLPAPAATASGEFETEINLSSFATGDYVIEIAGASGDEHGRALVAVRIAG